MSERDLQRIEVLTEVLAGRRTEASAATVLGVSVRQVGRLLLRYRDVVENKRLGHALAIVKAQQDMRREVKVLTNSEKEGYQKRGRQIYGPAYAPKIPAASAAVESRRSAKQA